MNVTSPPRSPHPTGPVDREELETLVEALIEEARQRARRRRRRNGTVALLVLVVGVAAFLGFGGRGGGNARSAASTRLPGGQGSGTSARSAPPLGALPLGAGTAEAVAFDPRSPQTVYVMALGDRGGQAGGYVFKTTDGGAHWHATATTGSGWMGTNEALAADPRHRGTLYAGTDVAVYKTVDGGRSWRPSNRGLFEPARPKLPSGTPGKPWFNRSKGWVIALAVDPANTNTVYAGSDRVSKSSDGGRSWTTVFPPHLAQYHPGDDVSALAVASTRPEAIYAITGDSASGRTSIVKSTDAGATWHETTSVRGTNDYGFATALAIAPQHPSTVYAALGANVLRTTDAGKTWQPIAHGLPITAGLTRTGGHCCGGVTSLAVDPRRTGKVYAALTQGGIYKTSNGGRTWIRAIYHPSYMHAVAVDPARPATIWAVGDAGVYAGPPRILRSSDGGRTWVSAP